MMSHMAFREDMHDESVVLRLAREVGSTDVLQMLYILSAADLAAVGPKVLNDWKLELADRSLLPHAQPPDRRIGVARRQNMIDERREAIRKRAAEWAGFLVGQTDRGVARQLSASCLRVGLRDVSNN